MKTKQPRIARITFGVQPIQTSYMVTDYHSGYNTGEYYYKKHCTHLLPHIKSYYALIVSTGNKTCNDFYSYTSVVNCLQQMRGFFKLNPKLLPLRTYK